MNLTGNLSCNSEEWRWPLVGYAYLAQGLAWTLLYVPCLLVISRQEYRQNIGYKLMLALGPIDLTILLFFGCIAGLLTVVGLPLPEHKAVAELLGAFGWSVWNAYCALTVTIAFSRCLALRNDQALQRLFGGRRAWYWVAVCYAEIPLFTGLVLASDQLNVFYHSGQGLNRAASFTDWTLPVSTLWNFSISLIIPLLYVGVVLQLRTKIHSVSDVSAPAISAKERSVMVQSALISLFTTFTAMSYITTPMITLNPRAFVFNQLMWLVTSGVNSVIYVGFNESIRLDVLYLLRLRKDEPVGAAAAQTPVAQQQSSHPLSHPAVADVGE